MRIPAPKPERVRGTFLGREGGVAPGWTEYDNSGTVERHTREIHEDVLRREGCSADRAREIAASSAEQQARLLETWRGEGRPAPDHRGSAGFRTPHFGEYAGRLCRVLEDGSLVPVGEP